LDKLLNARIAVSASCCGYHADGRWCGCKRSV